MNLFRKLAATIIMLAVLTSAAFAGAGNRIITIKKFDDGGLTTGPHDICVYLPEGYEHSDERYKVIYFSDGDTVFSFQSDYNFGVDKAVDGLTKDGLIEPAIMIAIATPDSTRSRDLTPTAVGDNKQYGGMDNYYKFITERLKPYIDANFRTKPDAASTGIAGSSFGGLSAFIMAYEHPTTFGIAGCMSPSFWWDQEYEIKKLTNDKAGIKPIRIWLDAGVNEYDMWTPIERVYKLLETKGWTAGDNLAAYLDYTGAHNRAAWSSRMRWMLYFLLRKEPLTFQSYRLVPVWNPKETKLELGRGHVQVVGPEALYAHDLRLTVPNPNLVVHNAKVAEVKPDDTLSLKSYHPGKTFIESEYLGIKASLKIVGYDMKLLPKHYICPQATRPYIVDGSLSEWDTLPYVVKGDKNQPIAYFGTVYDEKNVYIAIHVLDKSVESDMTKAPWRQDGIEVQFDGRPEPALRFADDGWDAANYLLTAISPNKYKQDISVNYHLLKRWTKSLPAETQSECVVDSNGHDYNTEISFPISYIEKQQGAPWKEFRINISIYNVDTSNGYPASYCWQPLWDSWQNIIGSGIFNRSINGF